MNYCLLIDELPLIHRNENSPFKRLYDPYINRLI